MGDVKKLIESIKKNSGSYYKRLLSNEKRQILSQNDQLAKNFIALYIIKNKVTFYSYYDQRQ